MTAVVRLSVHTAQQLMDLPQRMTLGQRQFELSLSLAGLKEPDRTLTEARLAALLSACGCTQGAIALILALPFAVWLICFSRISSGGMLQWGLGFGVLIAASVIGKLVGLARARQVLTHEIAAVLARL